jgi:hypothetical protein
MYSRSAKGGEKGDPNRNPWLAKMLIYKLVNICPGNQTFLLYIYGLFLWHLPHILLFYLIDLFKTLVLVLIFCLSHIFRHMYKLGQIYEILDSHHPPQKKMVSSFDEIL